MALVPCEDGHEYYMFHTRPRREKREVEGFEDIGLRHYLPLREQATARHGSTRGRVRSGCGVLDLRSCPGSEDRELTKSVQAIVPI